MLAVENRLKKVRDFNLLVKHGRYISGRFFTLKSLELAKNTNFFPKKEDPAMFAKQLKLAFVVGVKVSKSAVERNRLKRQMSEVVRLLIKVGQLKDGYYVMVVAKKEALGAKYSEAAEDVEGLLKKVGVLE